MSLRSLLCAPAMSCLLLLRTVVYLDGQHLHISATSLATITAYLTRPRPDLHSSINIAPKAFLASVPTFNPFFTIHTRSKLLLYFDNPISSTFFTISNMLFTTIAALLFPVAAMAVPTLKPVNRQGECTPVTLTLTEYVVAESPVWNYVSFNAQTQYTANSPADDVLRQGVNCEADGVTIPKGDIQCNIGGHRIDDLTFQLKSTSGGRAYKLDHTWQCDGYVPQPSPVVQVD